MNLPPKYPPVIFTVLIQQGHLMPISDPPLSSMNDDYKLLIATSCMRSIGNSIGLDHALDKLHKTIILAKHVRFKE